LYLEYDGVIYVLSIHTIQGGTDRTLITVMSNWRMKALM
jgi:hypothetical protein